MTSESVSSVMEKALKKVLPIPRVPGYYRPPLGPPKALSWVPSGKLGNPVYEERLEVFAKEIRRIDSQRTRKMKYSVRGWCYIAEGLGKIDKGQFDKFEKAINDCRKKGFLPIDFVSEDQDLTRRFHGIAKMSDPVKALKDLKGVVQDFVSTLPTTTTNYWKDEKYYVMMCVEKGDILNLFKPICDEYKVPIVSSKGWYPILLRYYVAQLSKRAEEKGLAPVLLLFYDLDPAGLKISDTYRKGLEDCSGGSGWWPDKLIVKRFGLNARDIEKYGLTWIENLKTGSGREARNPEYEIKFGRRKCESNALFRDDETLKAAEEICRNAIEGYYGKDVISRFGQKEETMKDEVFSDLYNGNVVKNFFSELDKMIASIAEVKVVEEENDDEELVQEIEVKVKRWHYGSCPACGSRFDFAEFDAAVKKLVRCWNCGIPMKLVYAEDDKQQ